MNKKKNNNNNALHRILDLWENTSSLLNYLGF